MIDLHQLRIFVLVADKKSFSAAAEEMLLTQPTVSSHIRRLEEELGTTLLDRLPRSVELTRAGEILHRHAREVLRLADQAVQEVREYSGRVTGSVEAGGSTIPGEYILPSLLGEFRAAVPEVTVNLQIADSREITTLVAAGRLELGMVGSQPPGETFESFAFCTDTLVLILPPGHRLATRAKVDWKELADEPLWLREPGSGSRATLEAALGRRRAGLRDLRVVGTLGSTEALKQAVASGAGVAIVSALAVAPECAGGRLAARPLAGLDLGRSFHLLRHRQRTPSPAARRLWEFIQSRRTGSPQK